MKKQIKPIASYGIELVKGRIKFALIWFAEDKNKCDNGKCKKYRKGLEIYWRRYEGWNFLCYQCLEKLFVRLFNKKKRSKK